VGGGIQATDYLRKKKKIGGSHIEPWGKGLSGGKEKNWPFFRGQKNRSTLQSVIAKKPGERLV